MRKERKTKKNKMNRMQKFIFNIKRKFGLVKFEVGGTDGVNQRYDELKEFMERIVGYNIDGIFVSDQTSLCDFEEYSGKSPTMLDFINRTKKIYNCDISKVQNEFLIDIIDYMKKKGVKFEKYDSHKRLLKVLENIRNTKVGEMTKNEYENELYASLDLFEAYIVSQSTKIKTHGLNILNSKVLETWSLSTCLKVKP